MAYFKKWNERYVGLRFVQRVQSLGERFGIDRAVLGETTARQS